MSVDRETQLETERLVLRRVQPDDAEILYAYRSDPAHCRYQGWIPSSVDRVHEFIADQQSLTLAEPGHWFQWMVCTRDDHQVIGDCGANFPTDKTEAPAIGYTLHPSATGRGYATEAVQALLKWLFVDLGVRRVTASTDPRNLGSIAVLERLGFRREAHHVESLWFKDAWVDDVIFALLKREWLSK